MRNHQPVKLLNVLIILFALVMVGVIVVRSQREQISALETEVRQTRLKQVEAESERSDLQHELAISNTKDYIEDKARTLYGYLRPGEIRFKVSNPDALYDEPVAEIVEEGK